MRSNFQILKKNKNFRLFYLGQFVSFFGTMISITVVPFQIYNLTQSSAMVGWVSAVELVPMLIAALIGGAVADSWNRKKLLVICELLMSTGLLILLINSCLPKPQVWLIFVCSAALQAVNGFHRPALDALAQELLSPEEIPFAVGLNSFRHGFAALLGPGLAGIIVGQIGVSFAYALDLFTFVFSVTALLKIQPKYLIRENTQVHLGSLFDSLQYARRRPELLGTYIIDFFAMVFAYPIALFPAISHAFGRPHQIGFLYSAMFLGSLIIPFLTPWASTITRHGRAVILSACFWGIGIILFGLTDQFWLGLFYLVFAGIADSMSGLFRMMIWNQTIPNSMRGRMAALEMISYMSGPLLGNARAGWIASLTTNRISIVSGGALCLVGVIVSSVLLPQFWKYRFEKSDNLSV